MATSKRERQKAARREKMERLQREQQRRRTVRRGAIIAVVAVFVIVTGALLFSNGSGKSNSASSTTSSTAVTTTTVAPTTTTTFPANKVISQSASDAAAVAAGCPASTTTRVNNLSWKSAPAMTINTAKTYYASVKTTAGTFLIKLDAKSAPVTTNNFVFLAQQKFYDCTIFHRVIPGFAIQGGDPTGTGTSGPGYTIKDEFPPTGNPTYPLWSVAMANTGQPHTGGSQFFIVSGASGETLPAQYSLFGQVVGGLNTVKMINAEGNSNPSANGVPPKITYRILNITITEK